MPSANGSIKSVIEVINMASKVQNIIRMQGINYSFLMQISNVSFDEIEKLDLN